jgi:hypothetical protein
VALGALLACSLAAAGGPEWVSDAAGCKVANPQPQPVETILWSGSCADGYADGPGTVRWFSDGRANGVTSGTFRQGRLHGRGYVTLPQAVYSDAKGAELKVFRQGWPSGSRLDGNFADNRLVGDGVITTPDRRKVLVTQVDGRLVRKARRGAI